MNCYRRASRREDKSLIYIGVRGRVVSESGTPERESLAQIRLFSREGKGGDAGGDAGRLARDRSQQR